MSTQAAAQDEKTFSKTVTIRAPVLTVWAALTDPVLMKKWMFETEIKVLTDWTIGGPIVIRGSLGTTNFENTGTVLQFAAGTILAYSHLSSLSRLADTPENHSILEFRLSPAQDQTLLTVTLSNFPTESIYKHLSFYWNVTPEVLKRTIEDGAPGVHY